MICDSCGNRMAKDAVIQDRIEGGIFKYFTCPMCGQQTRRPATIEEAEEAGYSAADFELRQ